MMTRYWDPFLGLRRRPGYRNYRWPGIAPMVGDGQEGASWPIPLDVTQEDDAIVVSATLPGVNPEDIDLSIENDILTLRGRTAEATERREGNYLLRERRTGAFHRSLRLPDSLDTENAQPRYDNGVLTIAFPKLAEKQARRLKVAVGNTLEPGDASASA